MCLLICKPAGKDIPLSYLREACCNNPDGAGLVYAYKGRLITEKGSKLDYRRIHSVLQSVKKSSALIHFRMATHGRVDFENQHPYKVSDEWSMAHNGVLSGIKCRSNESDTRAYIRENLNPQMDFRDKKLIRNIGTHIGSYNKFAFLHKSGEYSIANSDRGHWKNGIWYSNYSYESQQLRYGGGMSSWWEDEIKNYEYEVGDLTCDYCGEHVSGMGFGRKLIIASQGHIYCSNCK